MLSNHSQPPMPFSQHFILASLLVTSTAATPAAGGRTARVDADGDSRAELSTRLSQSTPDGPVEHSLSRRTPDDDRAEHSPLRRSADDVTRLPSETAAARVEREAAAGTVWRQSGTPGVLVAQDGGSPGPARPKLPAGLGLPAVRIPLSAGLRPRPIGRGRRQTAPWGRPQVSPDHQGSPRLPRGRRRGPWRLQNGRRGARAAPGPPERRQQPRRSPLAGEDIPPLPPPPPPPPPGQLVPPEPPSLPGPDEFPPLAPELRRAASQSRPRDDQQTAETADLHRQQDRKIVILYGSSLKEVDEVSAAGWRMYVPKCLTVAGNTNIVTIVRCGHQSHAFMS